MKRKNGQQIVEFIFLFPLLVVFILVILELSMFWQEYNAVQMVNEEINANLALENYTGMQEGMTCPAIAPAKALLDRKAKVVMLAATTYSETPEIIDGKEPYALYEFKSNETASNGQPVMRLSVDCRNTPGNGVVTQLSAFHRLVFFTLSIPTFSGERIEIIPNNLELISVRQSRLGHL